MTARVTSLGPSVTKVDTEIHVGESANRTTFRLSPMSKNRLRYSKGKDLLQHSQKSRFNREFVFPAAAAQKIARETKELFGYTRYTRSEHSDPVLTKAMELEGVFFRTPQEELEWQKRTPEEHQASADRHARRVKELIEDGKIVDLNTHICQSSPESSGSEYVSSQDNSWSY